MDPYSKGLSVPPHGSRWVPNLVKTSKREILVEISSIDNNPNCIDIILHLPSLYAGTLFLIRILAKISIFETISYHFEAENGQNDRFEPILRPKMGKI